MFAGGINKRVLWGPFRKKTREMRVESSAPLRGRSSFFSVLRRRTVAPLALLKSPRIWLGLLMAWVIVYHWTIAGQVIDDLRHGVSKPGLPLTFVFSTQTVSGATADAYDAGLRDGDALARVNGKPFDCMRVFYEAVNSSKPGDYLPTTVRSAKGTDFGVNIRIPPLATEQPTILEWLGQLVVVIGLPLFCLSLGFGVAFRRPKDVSAWLFLAMMIGFGGLALEFPVAELPNQIVMLVWWALFASSFGLWSTWIILFAVLFPAPTWVDRRLPWVRCIWIIPSLTLSTGMTMFEVGREISFKRIEFLRPYVQLVPQKRPDLLLPLGAILFFLLLIGLKSFVGGTPDGRRRLRFLLLGSLISLGPVLAQSARAIRNGSDLLSWAGPIEYFATLVPLLLFPVTLAYVILVRRAMDVRCTIRYGIRYTLAQQGLGNLQMIVTAGVIGVIAFLSAKRDMSVTNRIEVIIAGFLFIVLLRPTAQWLARRIDRVFFRRGLRAEQGLSELALSLRTLMDEPLLIESVSQKIAAALNIERIAFLLNVRGEFEPAYAMGYPNEPPSSLSESHGVARHLKIAQKASPIYIDDEKNWIHTIHPAEQESLRNERTEVVLPVAVKRNLLGILMLGSRRAEAPYTRSDLQLLDLVATHAGFALENSRLAAQRALDMADRENSRMTSS